MSTTTLDELRATQDLLQRAHDYVESFGFNIHEYDTPGTKTGPRCYIGTVRTCANLRPYPEYNPDLGYNDPGYGNGLELRRALEMLDAQVPSGYLHDRGICRYDLLSGRLVEKYGFFVQTERDEALRIFRGALTEVYRLIEAVDKP